MSDNRRTAPRRDAFQVGRLSAEGRAEPLECLVWDVSETGAQVEVAAEDVVPDRFTLRVTDFAPPRSCTVMRRDGRRLGVRFEA